MALDLPYMQFFVNDWTTDATLTLCAPATRGVWIDLLCAMHQLGRSGKLTGTPEQLARLGRCTTAQLSQALTDLQTNRAAEITERNGLVTVTNRRMAREAAAREADAQRAKRHRDRSRGRPPGDEDPGGESDARHASVTPRVTPASRPRVQSTEFIQPTSQPTPSELAARGPGEPPDPGWLAGWKSGISELGAAGVLLAETLATEAHGLGLKADEWLERVRFAIATANAPENAAKLADRGGAIVSYLRRNCWPVAGIVGADKLRAKAEKRAKKLEIDDESRVEFAKFQTLQREVRLGRRAGETREQIRKRLLAAGLDADWLSDRGWGVDDVREGSEQRESVAQGGQDVERVAG